jgi:hypothetical protein
MHSIASVVAVAGLCGCLQKHPALRFLGLATVLAGGMSVGLNVLASQMYDRSLDRLIDEHTKDLETDFKAREAEFQLEKQNDLNMLDQLSQRNIDLETQTQSLQTEIDSLKMQIAELEEKQIEHLNNLTLATHDIQQWQATAHNGVLERQELQATLEGKLQDIQRLERLHQENLDKLNAQLLQARTIASQKEAKIQGLLDIYEKCKTAILQHRQRIASLEQQSQLKDVQIRESIEAIASEVNQFLHTSLEDYYQRLVEAIEGVVKRQGEADKVVRLKQELEKHYIEFQSRMDRLQVDPFQAFVADALSLLLDICLAFSSIKVKLRNSLNSGYTHNLEAELKALKLSLVDSVPRQHHEAILSEFQQKNQKALSVLTSQSGALEILEHQVMTETEQEVRSLIEQIQELQRQIKLLQQPFSFHPATRYDHTMANLIITYFWRMGVVLDRAHTDYKGWESVVYFHTDRSPRSMIASELNDHSDRLQPLLKCLNVPKFDWDGELGLMKVRLQVANKPKEVLTHQDVSKIWKPSAQFEELVKGWRRVRITGGSGSGKSPTAENMAIAILKHQPGQVKLANPMHVSTKNHWSIPVTWVSHEESFEGIKELAQRVEDRAQSRESQSEFILYIFDEIDTTMEEHKGTASVLKSAFKQSSHQNLGIISTGQNANASNYKGMDRSDWNNAVNLHIGSNAYDAITNSNSLNSSEINRLKEQADKLTAYCEMKNVELGLLDDDPNAFRFALVVEPNKRPYFLELPAFGKYSYEMIRGDMSGILIPVVPPSLPTTIVEASQEEDFSDPQKSGKNHICPQCGSGEIRLHEKRPSSTRYKCQECKKSFSVKNK